MSHACNVKAIARTGRWPRASAEHKDAATTTGLVGGVGGRGDRGADSVVGHCRELGAHLGAQPSQGFHEAPIWVWESCVPPPPPRHTCAYRSKLSRHALWNVWEQLSNTCSTGKGSSTGKGGVMSGA